MYFTFQKNAAVFRVFFLFFFFLICQSLFGATITYQEDVSTNFKNPERGIRDGSETLIRIYEELGSYKGVDNLPQSVFDKVSNDCANARSSGKKIIMRFRYTSSGGTDAPLSRMLLHIEQLGPVLRANSDVIVMLEAGFIGCWGEWHYFNCTDQYGNYSPTSRKAVLLKLLEVWPKDRMIVLRYNFHKREIFGTDEPLGPDSAFSGSPRARVGAHNDCFGYNLDNRGTYQPTRQDSMDAQKLFLSLDNRYVPQEGETCGSSSHSVCDSALKYFKMHHWDGLSCSHLTSQWSGGGCLNTIKMKWGYRIALRDAVLPDSVRPGRTFFGSINLQNVGWGKIYNPRGCELVFRNNATKAEIIVKLTNDPRRWCMTDDVVNVPVIATLPANMPEGSYKLFLNLPDTASRLYGKSAYSIRVANNNVWEDATGYNSLLHDVVVSLKVNAKIAGAIQGLETFRVTKNNGAIKFTFGNFAAPTRLTMEIFALSGVKLWSRTVMAASGAQTMSWTGYSPGIHLVKLSFGDTRSSVGALGAVRSVIFKL
jgi:hypothetical protein